MCFSPQRRTIIRHRNVQKCSEDYSFLTFSLPNVRFAITFSLPNVRFASHSGVQCFDIRPSKCGSTAYNYSTSERPKVLRRLQFFHIFTSKCAFRHSGVELFDIGTSKSAPKTTVFSHFHFQMRFSPQRRTIIRHRNVQKCSEDYSFFTFSLPHVRFATAAYNYSTSERPKVLRRLQFFTIFTGKCAFGHSSVHFFDGWRAKSVSELTCFVHFHFKMCFSPQRRAFFRHLNLQKCSEHVMFCTFWLPNVLFATATCIFSTSELTKVLRTRHVLYILTSECAFRHSGVQFLISRLSSDLRTRRFNRPTFRLTRHTNHWKNTACRDVSNI